MRAYSDIHFGPLGLVHTDSSLVQPISGVLQASCGGWECPKSMNILSPQAEPCPFSLHNSANLPPTIRMLQKGMKTKNKCFGKQETPDPLGINKFNRLLLYGVFKDLECKFWHYSKRCSALSWNAVRFLGMSRLCSKTLMVCQIMHCVSEFRDANRWARHIIEFAELLLSVFGYSAVKLALKP